MRARRRDLEEALLAAERAIALIERCRPLNGDLEHQRLLAGWQRGEEPSPSFEYAALPDLRPLANGLAKVAEDAASESPWGQLYAERAFELFAEASIVAHIGTRDLARLAPERFALTDDEDRRQAESWAKEWSTLSDRDSAEVRIASDDRENPDSLLCQMQRRVGEQRLAFRVVVSELVSGAATGDGVIVIKRGSAYTVRDAQRIVVHEVEGHAMPRARAKSEALGLFRLGTRGGSDDEEGRALLLEERAGWFDDARKRELGLRHLAALAVRDGADWVETVRALRRLQATLPHAISVASRVHRGGGLAREVVYLPALSRVRRVFARDPELESWLERGRIGLVAAATLRELGEPPDSLGTPRAA